MGHNRIHYQEGMTDCYQVKLFGPANEDDLQVLIPSLKQASNANDLDYSIETWKLFAREVLAQPDNEQLGVGPNYPIGTIKYFAKSLLHNVTDLEKARQDSDVDAACIATKHASAAAIELRLKLDWDRDGPAGRHKRLAQRRASDLGNSKRSKKAQKVRRYWQCIADHVFAKNPGLSKSAAAQHVAKKAQAFSEKVGAKYHASPKYIAGQIQKKVQGS